jgi:hypothetical protein
VVVILIGIVKDFLKDKGVHCIYQDLIYALALLWLRDLLSQIGPPLLPFVVSIDVYVK